MDMEYTTNAHDMIIFKFKMQIINVIELKVSRIKFLSEDYFIKHTKITAVYNQY